MDTKFLLALEFQKKESSNSPSRYVLWYINFVKHCQYFGLYVLEMFNASYKMADH
jgi:hypothetical protein